MQRRDAYPVDSVAGCCFITGDYDPSDGIIDLDIFVDTMQPFGRLCVSPKAVRMLVQTLGWEWPSDDMTRDFNELSGMYLREHEENIKMRKAIAGILDARSVARIEDWMVET